jgi:NAD(P)H dehydrogenase (quinone)
MKHAVIVAHPNPESLTASCARAYAEAVEAGGGQALVRDLYGMGFDPCLKAEEIPGPRGYTIAEDVLAERAQLADTDVFAFVYPLWFNAPPAILKGYVDRVFSTDFGYRLTPSGAEPLLKGRKLVSFTFSGAPDRWVRETGALDALKSLLDRHLAAMCGLRVLDHVHAGGIGPGMRDDAAADIIEAVHDWVRANAAG